MCIKDKFFSSWHTTIRLVGPSKLAFKQSYQLEIHPGRTLEILLVNFEIYFEIFEHVYSESNLSICSHPHPKKEHTQEPLWLCSMNEDVFNLLKMGIIPIAILIYQDG